MWRVIVNNEILFYLGNDTFLSEEQLDEQLQITYFDMPPSRSEKVSPLYRFNNKHLHNSLTFLLPINQMKIPLEDLILSSWF